MTGAVRLDPATLRALAAGLDEERDAEAHKARGCVCRVEHLHAIRVALFAELASRYRTEALKAEMEEVT